LSYVSQFCRQALRSARDLYLELPGRFGSKTMIRFTFLIAAVVVLSIGGMIGYLLPLP
jgi:hypothetical protein